jgi:hypothetical protein
MAMEYRSGNASDAYPIARLHTSSWRSTYKKTLNAEYPEHTGE